jgi:hypothetical protein
MLQAYVLNVLICYRRMLQVLVDVAYACMLQTYVSSVFRCLIRMLASVSSGYCIYLQWFSNFFRRFRKCLNACFKCFIYLVIYVATVAY